MSNRGRSIVAAFSLMLAATAPFALAGCASTPHSPIATTEVCDGIPSFVEEEIVTSDYFCPWSAKVIAVE